MSEEKTARVLFSPSGKRGRVAHGTTVLDAARKLGVDIDSICGGRGLCGRCRVEPAAGTFARENMVSSPDHLGAAKDTERACIGADGLATGVRLACMAAVEGDVCIDVPAASQVHHQVVRKDCEAHDIEIDPVIRLHFVAVSRPDMETPDGDLQRLAQALEQEWGLEDLSCEVSVLRSLQSVLREGGWKVTVGVRDGTEIVAIWPGLRARVLGSAIDVGSTTIAVHLCDLATGEVLASHGAMNPQIRYGEDLMSRISYAMLNEGGAAQMTGAVRRTIRELLAKTAAMAGSGIEEILEITLVGNPVMHHLLLGLDPVPIGTAPFALATDAAVEVPAAELDLGLEAGARAYVLPCIAGYVGADTAAVMLAEKPWKSDEVSLLIDVGTNAEIVLGNRDRLLAASSPTGPAFEGAQISSGQRAAPGAIERVRIDPESLEPRFRVIGCSTWSDEQGFDAAIEKTGVTGICGSGIIEAVAGLYLAGVVLPDGVIDGTLASRTDRIRQQGRTFSYVLHRGDPGVVIKQGDVRAIQLAKAALHAGARLLMDRMGVDHVDRIRLAGAFGSHIDVTYAMVLGMLPDCDLEKVSSAANAAGTGARITLLNRASREEIVRMTGQVEKIETAVNPLFQQYFVEAMGIPHSALAYSHLARVMPLPVRDTNAAGQRKRRRQKR